MTVHTGIALPAAAIRRVLGLAHEAREINDRDARLAHALGGICGLTGADVGAIFVFDSPAAPAPQSGCIHGYSATQTRAVLAEYATQSVDFDLMAARLRAQFRNNDHLLSRRRRELLDDHHWYNSPFLNDTRRRWGVDDCIYSLQRVGAAQFGLGINRSFGSKPFSAEDLALVDVFNLAMAGVVSEHTPAGMPSINDACRLSLTPRAREILDCLLRGASNKDIAEQLWISPNTVHHHCKTVFRAFGVRSRSELIARWFATR